MGTGFLLGGGGECSRIVMRIMQPCQCINPTKGMNIWDLDKGLMEVRGDDVKKWSAQRLCLTSPWKNTLTINDTTNTSKLQGKSQCDRPSEELPHSLGTNCHLYNASFFHPKEWQLLQVKYVFSSCGSDTSGPCTAHLPFLWLGQPTTTSPRPSSPSS